MFFAQDSASPDETSNAVSRRYSSSQKALQAIPQQALALRRGVRQGMRMLNFPCSSNTYVVRDDARRLGAPVSQLVRIPLVVVAVDLVRGGVVPEAGEHDLVLPVDLVVDLQLVRDVDRRAGLEVDLHGELERERQQDRAEDQDEQQRHAAGL